MAYVFDLERDFDREPHVDADGSRVIDFALGYELDRSLIIVMSVILVPDASGAFELCFGIRTRSAAYALDVSPPDYSSATAKRFVPPAATKDVLGEFSQQSSCSSKQYNRRTSSWRRSMQTCRQKP
jgi:hypothetical protein